MDREIVELPVLPVLQVKGKRKEQCKKKYCIRIHVCGEWLVMDCYRIRYKPDNEWEYAGRYCINRQGRHGILKGRKLNQVTLAAELTGVYSYYLQYGLPKEVILDAGEEYDAREHMGWNRQYTSDFLREIEWLECSYNRDKRVAAAERKQRRIDMLMDSVPPLPEGLYGFLRQSVFPDDYMIPSLSDEYPDTGNYYCTACRKVHSFERRPKTGSFVVCEKTKRPARVIRKGVEKHEKARVLVLQEVDKEKSVARYMVFFREESGEMGGSSKYKCDEQARIMLYRDGFPIRKCPPDRCYHGIIRNADETEQEWAESNPNQTRPYIWPEWVYPDGVREALRGTRYEAAPVEEMAKRGYHLKYNEVMLGSVKYNFAGIMEYMVKMGLRKMVMETVNNKMTYGTYYGTLDIKGENATEIFGCGMQRIRRLRDADGGYGYLDWMRYEEEQGIHIREEVVKWLTANRIYPDTVTPLILNLMTPEQVKNYLVRETPEFGTMAYTAVLNEWKDYLSMAKRLKMDIADPIVHRTKHLKARHDGLVEVFESQKEDIAVREMAEKYPEVDAACMAIQNKFEWEGGPGDEYCIVVPRGIKDIMQDSRQLHHCAGSSERYYERIEGGETYLLFLRKKSEPEKAFYTLEVEPGGTVRQKRSEYNRQPDLEAVTAFLKKWQKEVRARLKAEDLAEAEESRKKRIEEMAVLQASSELRDQQLFKALSEDLNEADYGLEHVQFLVSAV